MKDWMIILGWTAFGALAGAFLAWMIGVPAGPLAALCALLNFIGLLR